MDRKLAAVIGAAARAARMAAGLTQAEVAERLGIATEVYGRLERGAMLPSVETLMRICTSLGVSPNELLGLGRGDEGQGAERPEARRDSPELRRLLRRVESLDRRKLRLLSLIAAEMGRQQKAARLKGAERPPTT
ncbi:MAG TPA: helix-turn-helix transcriptional regulator [Myxococcaceae bacterium]|nr:helix-turn-helix transcriptional regulator [Myxococcaceae bacterium]